MIGQGVVAETTQLAGLAGYATAGTIHLIVNNQIGFTTEPHEARSSRYCTETWKAVDGAILRVNAADPDACLVAADEAVAFRQTFQRDAVIDIVCTRRNGHNELDEPRFTQPLQYAAIDATETVRARYSRQLVAEELIHESWPEEIARNARAGLDRAYREANEKMSGRSTPVVTAPGGYDTATYSETGVPIDRLIAVADGIAAPPAGISLDAKMFRLLRQRRDALEGGIFWALAETLAFGSLVQEGMAVRLSGQDAVRGTFSHRHFSLTDTATGARHVPLNHLGNASNGFTALNSPLSEYAVLGFEYGYSLTRPACLTIWEARFGDFANGAQIVIDQFITSGEEKWQQKSDLVVLLPHGLEGQGPEHSSARIERLLPLCADGNIEIAQPSTPANYFHLPRRQALRPDRKSLFALTPKSLLRLPASQSPLADFMPARSFQPVLQSAAGAVRRILLCSGKIAYELVTMQAATLPMIR